MSLEKSYKLNALAHLSHAVRNGIRAAYYSQEQVKNSKNQIDKSIKEDDLTPEQLAIMLKALGRLELEETVDVKSETSSKEAELKQYETTLKNRENDLNNRETKLSTQEKEFTDKIKEFDQKVKMLLEVEKKLNEKKEALNERETKLQQQEAVLNQRKADLDKREAELQQKESTSSDVMQNVGADSKERDDSQQVIGIELRQSESNRMLSKDSERSKLILAAGKEICNKWLVYKHELLAQEDSWTEKLIYRFVQDFVAHDYPYCGYAVYDLVLYDLTKMREKKNGITD